MPQVESTKAITFGAVNTHLEEQFSTDIPAGKVLGNQKRLGVDLEKVLSVDNGALRIAQLAKPGWGHVGVGYGPFQREAGLAFLVTMLNGHNTSQTGALPEALRWHLITWLRGGSHTEERTRQFLINFLNPKNILRLLRSPQRWRNFQRIRYWMGYNRKNQDLDINENLAIGWFNEIIPPDPLSSGSAAIMHALGPRNGELWISGQSGQQVILSDIANIPIVYLSVLREKGAMFYISSLEKAHGMPTFPNFRPFGIENKDNADTLYPGIHQSVMGQMAFTVDSRVPYSSVLSLPEQQQWYGTAHYANTFQNDRSQPNHPETALRPIDIESGELLFSSNGARPGDQELICWIESGQPAGLISFEFSATSDVAFSVCWRGTVQHDFLELAFEPERISLHERSPKGETVDAITVRKAWQLQRDNKLTIIDDGDFISISLNDQSIFKSVKKTNAFQQGSRFGWQIPAGQKITFHHLEIHPREIYLNLPDAALPRQLIAADRPVYADDFDSDNGDLAGRILPAGSERWEKTIGNGRMMLSREGLRVDASIVNPNPGRTAYTLPWQNPSGAELGVSITPPGKTRGKGDMGRGGFIFWQDSDNYIIINNWNDDAYPGASISSFFTLNGEEDIFDAVWVNVGDRIKWGESHRLRAAFDGNLYQVWVNDEPVLYRALTDVYPKQTPLHINRVGLVANWEFGNDTGSIFERFLARELI